MGSLRYIKKWHLYCFFLLLIGCKKEGDAPLPSLETKVHGQVLVFGTNVTATSSPLLVKAYREYVLTNEPWRPLYKIMAETQTDSFGFFELNFTADDLTSNYYLAHETPIANYFNPTFQRVSIQAG